MPCEVGTAIVRVAMPIAGLLLGFSIVHPIGAAGRDVEQAAASAIQSEAPTTAVLIGQVVDAATGGPIPDAIVTLTGRPAPPRGPAKPAAGNMFDFLAAASAGRGSAERVAVDADGRFVFQALPVSTY